MSRLVWGGVGSFVGEGQEVVALGVSSRSAAEDLNVGAGAKDQLVDGVDPVIAFAVASEELPGKVAEEVGVHVAQMSMTV